MPPLTKPTKGFLVKSYLAHNVIFNEGSQGDTAYLLTDGEVEISTTVDGRKKVLAVLKPPALFGEMALFLDDQSRTATAMTLTDARMVLITRDALDRYLSGAPQIISSIMNVLVHRLKVTTKKASRAPNVPMGLCRILHLFQLNGIREVKYDALVRMLADAFTVSPETMERYVAALAEQGHLNVSRKEGGMGAGSRVVEIPGENLLEDIMQLKRQVMD
ncbi:MAG: Crp/Fnr family transcriptional regulator [Desulfovibrionaceae bacterium]